VVAVDGLSLSVGEGEIRGLIGPNGSGKTTTVNLLSGIYRADAGEISLRGERTESLRPHEIAARGVGRTFQVPKLFASMTVLENVLVPALAALDRGTDRSMAEILLGARLLLDLVSLESMRDTPARELSGGQAMLAQLARAFMVHPLRLLLLDEPFAGLHPTIRAIIIEAVIRMNREEGVTVLVVSHEMAELRRLCSRVSVMHEGALLAEGTLDEVANDARVLEAYLGR
jgi:branched-chain amino acid transport system ATP-binding protein